MAIIVALGGGELKTGETRPIDEWIVAHARRPHPRCLFIPTASEDAPSYCMDFRRMYDRQLGGSVHALNLLRGKLSQAEIGRKVLAADVIYVGGGDTAKMLEVWQGCTLPYWLSQAYARGCVLSGNSAGAICWFEFGYSDSDIFAGGFGKLAALGLEKGIFCPHYDGQRQESFDRAMLTNEGLRGWAVEDGCALVIADGLCQALPAVAGRRAFALQGRAGRLQKVEIEAGRFRPVGDYFSSDEARGD